MRKRSLTGLAGLAAVPVVALVLASCGSSGGSSSSAATTSPASTTAGASAQQATVDAGSTSLGSILVDSQGRTLYLFQADSGTTSSCTGSCATAWPPVRATGQPTAGDGINASSLGMTPRSDGDPQVTYNGHPLYTFVKDTSAGQTNGEGVNAFGGLWYALSPAGDQVTGGGAAATPSSGY